jgi:hypothetical protein
MRERDSFLGRIPLHFSLITFPTRYGADALDAGL